MPKNVTISLPDEFAKRMEGLPEVNWSEVCRKAIADYIEAREPPKSEIIKNLENYLKSKRKTEEEQREPVRSMEISRFTKKWGEPDSVHPDPSPGAWHPYVFLEKNIRLKHNGRESTLKVANGLISIAKDEKGERKKTDLAVIKERWKDCPDVLDMAEYFNSIGFNLQLDYSTPLGEYSRATVQTWTGLNRDYIDDTINVRNRSFELLFAFDKEDTVFLGSREVARPPL